MTFVPHLLACGRARNLQISTRWPDAFRVFDHTGFRGYRVRLLDVVEFWL